ncbi:MAG: hypothetical protein KF835_14455 [Xanthobacteraceae bacterium]|nr:hypothetical protein [Xanthobacteraceae bacterium]
MTEAGNLPGVLPIFRGVKDTVEIEKRFATAAKLLINCFQLRCEGREPFSITSLELYLKLHDKRDIWWDPSTDKGPSADEQFNAGTWYVRQKKAQRRWRIDITAGSRAERIQAGILIRQLDGLGGPQPGPAVALHSILRGRFSDEPFDSSHLAMLNQIHGKKIDGTNGSPLILERRKNSLDRSVAKGKRINIPKALGSSTRDALLRVSLWRKHSSDIPI